LDGKLEFFKMVKGENDSTYLTLKRRFSKLTESKEKNRTNNEVNLDSVLDLFVKKGLGKAMELFKKIK